MRLDLYTNPDRDKCIRAVGLDPDKVMEKAINNLKDTMEGEDD